MQLFKKVFYQEINKPPDKTNNIITNRGLRGTNREVGVEVSSPLSQEKSQ